MCDALRCFVVSLPSGLSSVVHNYRLSIEIGPINWKQFVSACLLLFSFFSLSVSLCLLLWTNTNTSNAAAALFAVPKSIRFNSRLSCKGGKTRVLKEVAIGGQKTGICLPMCRTQALSMCVCVCLLSNTDRKQVGQLSLLTSRPI